MACIHTGKDAKIQCFCLHDQNGPKERWMMDTSHFNKHHIAKLST